MNVLITCKKGFEEMLAREAVSCGARLQSEENGCILGEMESAHDLSGLCFASYILLEPLSLSAASVNVFAQALTELFTEHIRPVRIDKPWSYLFSSSDSEKLTNRVKAIQGEWAQKVQKKMSRVAKLGREGMPQGPEFAKGFFVHFVDLDRAFVSFEAFSQGQQRMAMDHEAPSRSFLKLEEAFCIFGHEPKKNDLVVDLGASPGGWSYSALKRGAHVIAVDRGSLQEPVRSHVNIRHLKVDALTYQPYEAKRIDWFLCDVIENPFMILNVLHKWISQRWCHYFVVNLKVGRMDPIPLLKDIHDPKGVIAPLCPQLIARQLYHDREEITLIGEVG